jgi:TrmH family RNA methyltransferase
MPTLPVITSAANPLIKQIRALRHHKERAATGLFVVEGIHHAGEAVEAGWQVDALVYAPELLTSEYAHTLLARAAVKGIRCQPVSPQVMESLAEKENPQGLLAVVAQRNWKLDGMPPETFRHVTALVSPQDPGNVGAILRTIDAVGTDGLILLDGGVDLYHPSVVRASMGALFWKPVVRAGFDAFVPWARQRGYTLIGTSAHATVDYHKVKTDGAPWVLMLGSEQKGLSAGQVAACDAMVSLPMRGRASSLNLAVAAGVLLYALAGDGV